MIKNKLLVLLIGIGIVFGISLSIFLRHPNQQMKSEVEAVQTIAQKQITTQQPSVAPGIPTAISIPKINVHAVVESVGMDAQGRMDIPHTAEDTAWFSPGYKPGMNGSAVIDGHLDKVTGAPAVFWNLKLLSAGDHIVINENNGKTYTFAVDRIMRYPYNSFPIKEVFSVSQTPRLNLITCNGTWDKNTRNYSDRLVVYSKLVAEK